MLRLLKYGDFLLIHHSVTKPITFFYKLQTQNYIIIHICVYQIETHGMKVK